MEKKITHLWGVSKNGLCSPKKYTVARETPKTFVLYDGTIVRKETMSNTYVLYYTDETKATQTYNDLRKVFDDTAVEENCNYCNGDEPIMWIDNENNAFIDSKGEMLVTAHDKTIRFKVKCCPMCGKNF